MNFIYLHEDNNPHRGSGPSCPRCATKPEPVRQNFCCSSFVAVAIDIRGFEKESEARMSDSENYRNLKVISV